jgi:hypothetical protein
MHIASFCRLLLLTVGEYDRYVRQAPSTGQPEADGGQADGSVSDGS